MDENTYSDPKYPNEIYTVDYPVCECNKLKFSKLPCSHIMRYCIENQINPMKLVDRRYLFDPQTDQEWTPIMGNLDELTNELKGCKLLPKIISTPNLPTSQAISLPSDDENDENDENIKKMSLAHPVRNLKDNLTVMERYNLIMSEAKQVAQEAAESEDKTDEIIHLLRSKWKDYSINRNNDNDVIEAAGVSVGRPRKSRYKSSSEKKTTKKRPRCNVCQNLGFSSEHPKQHCKYAQMLKKISESNNIIIDNSKKCTICNKFGHLSKDCMNIKTLKERLDKQLEESSS